MVIEAGIMFEKEEGTVVYDEKEKKALVIFPDEEIEETINDYLTKIQSFRIPQSQKIDDFEVMKAKPIDNETFFSLALSSMYSEIDVWVDWSKK